MLSPIGGRRKKHKRFDYTPRYYDPEKEKKSDIARKIKMESKVRRGPARSVILYAAILFILFYFFLQL